MLKNKLANSIRWIVRSTNVSITLSLSSFTGLRIRPTISEKNIKNRSYLREWLQRIDEVKVNIALSRKISCFFGGCKNAKENIMYSKTIMADLRPHVPLFSSLDWSVLWTKIVSIIFWLCFDRLYFDLLTRQWFNSTTHLAGFVTILVISISLPCDAFVAQLVVLSLLTADIWISLPAKFTMKIEWNRNYVIQKKLGTAKHKSIQSIIGITKSGTR